MGHKYRTWLGHHLPAFPRGWVGVFFNLQTQHEFTCSNTLPQPPSDITDGGTSPWETYSVSKRNGDHLPKLSIHCESRQPKHSTRPLLVQKCKCACCDITMRARAILTNHGLRHCPWHAYARLGGGTGRQDQVLSPPRLAWSGAHDVTLNENKQINTTYSAEQNHGLQPRYFGQNWPTSVFLKISSRHLTLDGGFRYVLVIVTNSPKRRLRTWKSIYKLFPGFFTKSA